MLKEADANGDGRITFEEFKEFMAGTGIGGGLKKQIPTV